MDTLLDDFIEMNESGQVLALCEKYYDDNVEMFSNGAVFARSMTEAYEKQKGFIESVVSYEVKLLKKVINNASVELTFLYKMTNEDGNVSEFTGKHVQTWQNNKIIKEEYVSVV